MEQARIAVLILAGGNSRDKMPGLSVYRTSPAFLPINSRSLGKLVIDSYLEHDVAIYMALNPTDLAAAREEFACFGTRLILIDVGETGSVIETLGKAVRHVQETEVIVNLVTTIPRGDLTPTHGVVVDKVEQLAEDWSALDTDQGQIRFIKKSQATADLGFAFSGIFRARREDINAAAAKIPTEKRRDLLEMVEALHARQPMTVVHREWFDCGHTQNYFRTRKKIFGSRFFNQISIDEDMGLLIKTSTDKVKLKRESEFANGLPATLRVLFPRVIWTEETAQTTKVAMEFYGYPTLAEILLYWDLAPNLWASVFDELSKVLDRFAAVKAPPAPMPVWREMYSDKVVDRCAQYARQHPGSVFFGAKPVTLNGVELLPWPRILAALPSYADRLFTETDYAVMHGDFCFNNILCEPYVGLIKLLDPRGAFGAKNIGVYGDRKYDWAKLGHSVVGKYDYIVNDLFEVSGEGTDFKLRTFSRPWQEEIEALYWNHCEVAGIKFEDMRYIMGTLFVSLAALHEGKPQRQAAFILTGLQLLSESLA